MKIRKIASYMKNSFRIALIGPRYLRVKKDLPAMRVLSVHETIDEIVQNNLSIARFGEGEISWMLPNYESRTRFQQSDDKLAKRLREVINMDTPKFKVALPVPFSTLKGQNVQSKAWWMKWLVDEGGVGLKYLSNSDHVFLNAMISRFWIDEQNVENAEKSISLLKRIWVDREVIMIEGKQTRFGVGNDFLGDTKMVKRVLIPSENAFDKYDEILKLTCKTAENLINPLVLMAAGPTATILAWDLAQAGIQAVDIGHADIEYEWYLKRSKDKISIVGKYVNESTDGQNPIDVYDERYENEIMHDIS